MNNFKRIALAGAASLTLMAVPAYADMLGGSVGVGANVGTGAAVETGAVGVHTGVDTNVKAGAGGDAAPAVGASGHSSTSADVNSPDVTGTIEHTGAAVKNKVGEVVDTAKDAGSAAADAAAAKAAEADAKADANVSAKGAASVN